MDQDSPTKPKEQKVTWLSLGSLGLTLRWVVFAAAAVTCALRVRRLFSEAREDLAGEGRCQAPAFIFCILFSEKYTQFEPLERTEPAHIRYRTHSCPGKAPLF